MVTASCLLAAVLSYCSSSAALVVDFFVDFFVDSSAIVFGALLATGSRCDIVDSASNENKAAREGLFLPKSEIKADKLQETKIREKEKYGEGNKNKKRVTNRLVIEELSADRSVIRDDAS